MMRCAQPGCGAQIACVLCGEPVASGEPFSAEWWLEYRKLRAEYGVACIMTGMKEHGARADKEAAEKALDAFVWEGGRASRGADWPYGSQPPVAAPASGEPSGAEAVVREVSHLEGVVAACIPTVIDGHNRLKVARSIIDNLRYCGWLPTAPEEGAGDAE